MQRQTKMIIFFFVVVGGLMLFVALSPVRPQHWYIKQALADRGCERDPVFTELRDAPAGYSHRPGDEDTFWRADACASSWEAVMRTTLVPARKGRDVTHHELVFIQERVGNVVKPSPSSSAPR